MASENAIPSLALKEETHVVDEVELYYRIGGSGPPLILLSGFTMTGESWNPFLDELGKEHTVIVPDLPGHGRSTAFSGHFSHRKTAEFLFDLLDKLGLGGCRGMGLSSGANILMWMALQQPARVEAMVLISSAHRWLKQGRERFRDRRWETLSPEWREGLLLQHPGGEPQCRALIDELRAMVDNHEDFTTPEHLSTITANTLVAYGDRDRIDPVEEALEAYRAIPNAALWVVPGQGHGAGHSADPEGFLRVVRVFLMPAEPSPPMDATPSLRLREETVTVDGVELYYRIGGSGPPLLLLHGFTLAGRHWNPFLDALGQHYTIIVPDLPGHGRSSRPKGDFTHVEAARLTFGLLDAMGIERISGIGHSTGAIVLLQMAIKRPERMEAMVLVAGAHRLPQDVRQERGQGAHRWENLTPQRIEYARRAHPGGDEQIRWVMAQMDGFGDNYVDFSVSPEQLMTIETPSLLVWGDRDLNFPVEFALEMYRAMPNAALWVLPGQGHMAVWRSAEARGMFPGIVHKFLQGELTG